MAALNAGLTVRMSTLAGALADLMKQESLPATGRRLRRYDRPGLLILDELGYLPCDGQAADMLFSIITRRHEKNLSSYRPTRHSNSGASPLQVLPL